MALPEEYQAVIDVHQEGTQKSGAFFDSAEYRENLERFTDDLEMRPTPYSYRDGAIALRGLIRLHKKNGRDYHHLLAALYRLACEQEFMCSKPYVEGLGSGYDVAEKLGVKKVDKMKFSYEETGIEGLELLKITDRKLLLEAAGEPTGSLLPSAKYLPVWQAAETECRNARKNEWDALDKQLAAAGITVSVSYSMSPSRAWPGKIIHGLQSAVEQICGEEAVAYASRLALVEADLALPELQTAPALRLAYVYRFMPASLSYKEAAIALRAMQRAEADSETSLDFLILQVLFRIACEQAFLFPEGGASKGIWRIGASGCIPRADLDSLEYPAQSVNTDILPLLTAADRRRLQPWFSNGPGAEHPFTIHQNTWKLWAQRYSETASQPPASAQQRQATPQQKPAGFWGAVRRLFIGNH